MAMLPNMRIGAMPLGPSPETAEETPGADLFAALMTLAPEGPDPAFGLDAGVSAESGASEAGPEEEEGEGAYLTTELAHTVEPALLPLLDAQRSLVVAFQPPPAPPAGAAPEVRIDAPPAAAAPVARIDAPPAGPGEAPAPAPALPQQPIFRAVAGSPAPQGADAPPEAPVPSRPEPAQRIEAALRQASVLPAADRPTAAAPDQPRPAEGAAAPLPTTPSAPVLSAAPPAFAPLQAAPAPAQAQPVPQPQAASVAEQLMEIPLELAREGEWLDRLARDISRSADGGVLRFRLNPETLGTLNVELSQGAQGASVRLTAETEAARAIIAEAQPRLIAEARAQGVRIAEAHVDLGGGGGASGQSRRHGEETPTFVRTHRQEPGDPAADLPRRAASDRYA